MYLWKCWRDTRSTFLVIVAAVAACGAFGAYVYSDPFGWIAAKPEASRVLWNTTGQWMLATAMRITPLAGFVLGIFGVGMEFEKRTADFLLTRPQARRRLLWTSWGVGTAEVLALTAFGLALSWLVPYPFTPPRAIRVLLSMCIMALVIYSVTYLTTTLARHSRNGLGLSLLVFSAYGGVCVWLRYWYEIQVPIIFELIASASRRAADIGILISWFAVGIASAVAAQYVFERQEV